MCSERCAMISRRPRGEEPSCLRFCACAAPETTAARVRSSQLADRLQAGAAALLAFARPLTEAQWHATVPGDGRTAGVLVHHVATVYPLEVRLAQLLAAGTPIVGVTWTTVHEMNAAHAVEHCDVSKEATLALLAENSAAAAAAIREFTDADLDRAGTVSLYADAELYPPCKDTAIGLTR